MGISFSTANDITETVYTDGNALVAAKEPANPFRPIEGPRYWKGPWAERWLQGTGNKPHADTAHRVVCRIYVRDKRYEWDKARKGT